MNKIWIYQADRFLTDEEVAWMNEQMAGFTAQWKAHGVKLNAEFDVLQHLFLIVKVDEDRQNATGCSIDESVHFIKQMQEHIGVNFFNRQRVAYKVGNELKQCSLPAFKKLIQEGLVDENTPVFNNTLTDVSDFDSKWLVAAGHSWLKPLLAL
ncbi:ABC transporter ATPase [bacterium]|nr:ABC transporter ATPase [bacterium]